MGELRLPVRRLVIVACGEESARGRMARELTSAAPWLEVREAASDELARSEIEARGGQLAAVICDEALRDAEDRTAGWALLTEVELRWPDAYRAMIYVETPSHRPLELKVHGGEAWVRDALDMGRIVARVLASACSLPALAIAACGLAEQLGLGARHARIMSAHVLRRSRKQVADDLGIPEATCGRCVTEILASMGMATMDDVATEVLRRALNKPTIPLQGRLTPPITISLR